MAKVVFSLTIAVYDDGWIHLEGPAAKAPGLPEALRKIATYLEDDTRIEWSES